MQAHKLRELISKGRTDYIFQFIKLPDWKELLHQDPVKLLL